jgi:hypothetical protein
VALAAQLGSFGAYLERLRPPAPCKDWNEALSVYDKEMLRRFIGSSCTVGTKITDPPADLSDDTSVWVSVLRGAHAIDGNAPEGIFGALLGLRSLGAGLQLAPSGARLVAGQIDAAEYAEWRQSCLLPHQDMLKLLLCSYGGFHDG